MSHYFVSYSRKDSEIVNLFVSELKNRGFDIWQDVSGTATGIPFSTKWFDVIIEAIYYSSGAFILYSENWESSDNCKDEGELIRKTNTPCKRIDVAGLRQDPESVLKEAELFIKRTSSEPGYERRCRVFSSAYALKNGTDPHQLIERPNSIRRAIRYFIETILMFFGRQELEEYDPEFYPYIKKYTSFAFGAALRSLFGVVLGIVMAVVLVLSARPVNYAINQSKINQRNAVDDKKTRAIIKSCIYRDPMFAITRFTEMNLFAFASSSAHSLLANASKLAGTDMPSAVMFGNGEALTQKEITGISERFTVTASDGVGMIRVRDNETGTEAAFITPGQVTAWAWNRDGSILAFCCSRDVFVYDPLSSDTPPLRLSVSVYPISEIGFFEIDGKEKILAGMEELVVVWDIPYDLRSFRRTEQVSGCLLPEEGCAIYIADGFLILNRDNKESVLPVEVPSGADLRLVTSGTGTQAALIYELSGEYYVLFFDIETGSAVKESKLPCAVHQAVFSESGDRLWLAGDDVPVIAVVTGSGKVYSASEKKKGYFVVPYGDQVCCVDEELTFTMYNKKCRRSRMTVLTDGYYSGEAEGVALPDANHIYTTALWPGKKMEVRRVDLKEKTEEYVLYDCDENDAVCTAVALSQDQRFLAYGYEDGTVRVFAATEPYPLYEDRPVAEPIKDLRFCTEDDDILSILGGSGTVYSADLDVSLIFTDYLISGANRETITNKLIDKARAYYIGILDEDGVQVHADDEGS